MTIFTIRSIRKIARQATFALMGFVLCLGLLQAPAQAASATDAAPAAQQESLSQMRADRRAENSRASQMADADAVKDEGDSIGETIKEKLNLDEMVEENVLLGKDYEPDEAKTNGTSNR